MTGINLPKNPISLNIELVINMIPKMIKKIPAIIDTALKCFVIFLKNLVKKLKNSADKINGDPRPIEKVKSRTTP